VRDRCVTLNQIPTVLGVVDSRVDVVAREGAYGSAAGVEHSAVVI
jgi:hypothetical protein